jgi:hypothetical protein
MTTTVRILSDFDDLIEVRSDTDSHLAIGVTKADAPRLLRDLAEATATACGWEASTSADSPEAGHVTLGCAHGATSLTPTKARALAVALLRAADEAEASK